MLKDSILIMGKEHNESKPDKQEEKLSICEIMKDDTSEVIRKIESQIPSLFQNYSNLYTKYLHMFDDMFLGHLQNSMGVLIS